MALNFFASLRTVLLGWNFTVFWAEAVSRIFIGTFVLLLAWLVWLLTVKIVYRILERAIQQTRVAWGDELLNQRIFHRLAWIMPALVLRTLSPGFLEGKENLLNAIITLSNLVILVSVTLSFIASLNFVNSLYSRRKESARRPIKGIVQAVQVLFILAAAVMAFSYISNEPIGGIFTGIGAISAVLMLIFRDPLMGLVSGFQISSNDMLRIGDWVEMPSHGADGEVIEISLLNVTVRNWDKNYIMIPIQAFTAGAFKNWRGMADCGGRRIKRFIAIDLSTIRFLSEEEIEHLSSIALLKNFLAKRRGEISSHNEKIAADREASPVNGRALTNIGVFRSYALAYLQNHEQIRGDLTLMVRQLQSGSEGLPLEFYFFTKDTEWTHYEGIQSDIFDHILASLEEFGLKVFQRPSGVVKAEAVITSTGDL